VDPALFDQPPHPRLSRVSRALDDFEIAVVLEARRRNLPLLAICRGVQVLNVAYGGNLHQHIPDCVQSSVEHGGDQRWELRHVVQPASGSLFASIFGSAPVWVNSMHHQTAATVGEGLAVSAICPDDGIIEALEDPAMRFCLGVQFHPEELGEPFHPLFDAFVAACRTGAI
jgi:putative glutamine amidotransferase